MYRLVVSLTLGFGLAALVAPSSAYAMAGERVYANVPFSFHVKGALLPPGEYIIQRADLSDPHLLQIRSKHGTSEAFFLTDNATPAHSVRNPELVFDRYGNVRFLHAIWLPDETGSIVQVSRTEIRSAEEVARAHTETSAPAGKGR
jgi:hypothetical protein